ncbi:MAG: LytTR family DNA-binding domain-containing protein, partial [Symbiobacteriaceae bacterium]|nr:LytTR family DNA-binding domain-containing protein [Symbiobacteriaceae bacterium]
AHKIRADNEHIPIIFITRHDELALDSYGVHALNFIVKPIDEARMFTTLDRLASILERRVKGFFSCNIEGTLRRFPYYEILYFVTDAADGHYILINGDASLRFRNKISDLVNSNPEIFILCHQSYIVNLDHLRTIQGNTATLSDGSVVAISKGNLSRVRQRFLNQYRVFA